jgi:gamma-glutamyltranspeptidase/glutathione hydrolase
VTVRWTRQRSIRVAASGRRATIAAARRESVDAGLAMFERGGNAMDAAIAAAFVAGVVEPMETTLAGSGFMLVFDPVAGRPVSIEFGPRAPRAAKPDMFELDRSSSVDTGLAISAVVGEANIRGAKAAGVPATVVGLCAAQARFGRLPLACVVAPAIAAAHDGFAADGYYALEVLTHLPALRADPGAAAAYLERGDVPAVPHLGTATMGAAPLVKQAALGRTLELLVAKGRDSFCRGPVADGLLATHRDLGGLLSAEDLAAVEPRLTEPLTFATDGGTVCVPAAPTGGITILQILSLLRALRAEGADISPATLALASWHAFADRYHWLGDPEHVPVPVAGLLSDGYARHIAGLIRAGSPAPLPQPDEGAPWAAFARRAVHDPWPFGQGAAPEWRPEGATPAQAGTTHVSVIDGDGMAVSITHTAANHFGAKTVCPRTGLLLDAAMGWFNACPGAANSIAPGKRPLANMGPALILREGRALAAAGAPGGRRIIGAMVQVIDLILAGQDAGAAVAAPRLDASGTEALLDEEMDASSLLGAGLPMRIVTREHQPYGYELARPVVATRNADGLLHGAVDPYSTGFAAAL